MAVIMQSVFMVLGYLFDRKELDMLDSIYIH